MTLHLLRIHFLLPIHFIHSFHSFIRIEELSYENVGWKIFALLQELIKKDLNSWKRRNNIHSRILSKERRKEEGGPDIAFIGRVLIKAIRTRAAEGSVTIYF